MSFVSRGMVRGLCASTAVVTTFLISQPSLLAQDASVALDEIVITTSLDAISDATTKTDDKLIETLAGTSVVTDEETKRFQPYSPKDLLTAVPGVNVEEKSDDPGSSINIRGLQDFGRVNVMIDGARQNFQRTGHNANGQFYFEPEMIKKVDIVRGPVSTIYGSGAIGGVVNFETIDPADMLRHNEQWAGSLKTTYGTNDDAILLSAIGAARMTDTVSVIGNFVWRDHDNYEDGDGNEIANTNRELVSGLVKGVFDFAPGNQLKLSYIHKEDEFVTATVATGGARFDTEAEDRTLSGQWLFNPQDNDLIDLHVSAYFTSTTLDQIRIDASGVVPAGSTRSFDIETFGFDIYNSTRFATGLFNHTLTYGGDYFKDDVTTVDNAFFGTADNFTPSGEREAYGFFIQDKLEYGDWLEIIGALRYDEYELNGDGVNIKDDQLSPKLTVGVTPIKGIQFFATYAEGFRAPAISETLQNGIHPPPVQFEILPNPNLVPETAENWEGGVNLAFDNIFSKQDTFRAKATLFRNEVDNFIEDREVIPGVFFDPPGPPDLTTCFEDPAFCGARQYINVAKARLEGFELEAAYDNSDMFVQLAYTHVRGDDLVDNVPLASVFPDKLVTTVGFRFLEDKLVVGGRWTYVAGQDRVPPPEPGSPILLEDQPSESYNLVDLFATYEVNKNFTAGLSLNNIFDEKYRPYRQRDADPGFNAKLSATIRFGSNDY